MYGHLRFAGKLEAHERDEMKVQKLAESNDFAVLQAASLDGLIHHFLAQMFNEVRGLFFF
ncbi:hypothetical protein TC41_2063 [Alicyclobacillus acidocaldarius subsp. acidocaldarius Tc-4-1]|uniref:Uncharacterized protein n=1 Tax=Alicyclobacillus acidocaldarius (strain Tc-4-1) TaxID=1048834 RepID=F8IES8_ALIAT|nr:hypothetical protein TC41_2063 [Alicyclobacillus acidocaldarius subsp. acidocaldarius Tc-4-1]